MPTSSPTPVAPAADDLFGGFDLLGWAIANIWITLGVLAVLIFGINYGIKKGWSYLTLQANAKGEPLAPLGDILRRARLVMFKEDNNPVFLKNQALAQRFAWLTWKRYWTIITVLNVVAFVALVLLRNVFALGFFGACVIAFALGIGRLRKIFTYRHWVLMQMFQVAATQMRYENGSQLNPWGYVQITEWHELNNPGTTIVRYKAKYRADNENIQKAFEAHFNGAISDQHTWNYTWEPAQTRVVCEPTPLITDRAEYPFPDMHPWNEFPLGISEGGQEAVWTISVHPHALVAGTTGSGKSVTQRTILMHALQSPEWRIVLVDPKRVELSGYKDHPNVLKVATELDESVALIEQVEEEMQSRYRRMQEKGVNFFRNLDPHPPAIMLMVDETFALLSPTGIKSEEGKEQDAMKARIGIMLGSIARLGRAAGIHMILATQRPDAKVLPGEVKANLDARIAQGRMDNTPSLMTLDSDAATKIPPIKGRAVFRAGGEAPRMFQAYFLKEEELGMALQLAKSLALEELTPDMFLDKPEEEEEAPKRKLPKIKTPKLPQSGWFARWVEKRKALVEENERRSDKAVADRQLRRKGGEDLPQVDRSEIEEEFLHAGQSEPHTSGADTSGMALFPAYATAQSTLFDPLPATPAAALPEIEEDLDDFADLDDLEPEVAPPAPQAPVAAPVAPTPDPAVPALSVEEVMQRASERGVAIPASELLAALRAEAARQSTPEAGIEEPAAVEASEEPTPSAAPAAGVPRRPQLPGAPAAAAPAAPQAPSAAPGALGLPPLPPRRQR